MSPVFGWILSLHWRTAMDGAHKRQRQLRGVVVGDAVEAGAKRQRVQRGVAAAGRKGQATQIGAAAANNISAEVREEVAKAMEAGSSLVQASIEHLETAERSWDKWIVEHGIVVRKFPTEVQVLSYMYEMSRTRQRECLAQRGKRRRGGQKRSVRNYVAELGNNRWVSAGRFANAVEHSGAQEARPAARAMRAAHPRRLAAQRRF